MYTGCQRVGSWDRRSWARRIMRQKVFFNEISHMTLYVYVCKLVANVGCALLNRRRRTLLLYLSPLLAASLGISSCWFCWLPRFWIVCREFFSTWKQRQNSKTSDLISICVFWRDSHMLFQRNKSGKTPFGSMKKIDLLPEWRSRRPQALHQCTPLAHNANLTHLCPSVRE